MGDPRRLFESKDMEGAVLYAKRISNDASDAWPVLAKDDGSLTVNITSGTVSLSLTAVTVTNSVSTNTDSRKDAYRIDRFNFSDDCNNKLDSDEPD